MTGDEACRATERYAMDRLGWDTLRGRGKRRQQLSELVKIEWPRGRPRRRLEAQDFVTVAQWLRHLTALRRRQREAFPKTGESWEQLVVNHEPHCADPYVRALIHLTAAAWDTSSAKGPEFPNLGLLPFRTAFVVEDVPYHSGQIPGKKPVPDDRRLNNVRSRLRRTHALEALMIDAPVLATVILEAPISSLFHPAVLELPLETVDLCGWRKPEDLARCICRAISQVIRGRLNELQESESLSSNLEPGEVWWPRHAHEPRIFLDVESELLKFS